MRHWVRLFLIGLSLTLAAGPLWAQVRAVDHPDALVVTHALGCLSPADYRPEYTPADLVAAMRACAAGRDYVAAVQVVLFSDAQYRFDKARVTDPTAHDAMASLFEDVLILPEHQARMQNAFFDIMDRSPDWVVLCERLHRMGPPTYQPYYMLAHGLDAFAPDGMGGLRPKRRQELAEGVAAIDAAAVWAEILADGELCGQ